MLDLGERVALFLDVQPHRADSADNGHADAIDCEWLQQNAKPAGMVLLVRDHTDQQNVVLKCFEVVGRGEERSINAEDVEPPAILTAGILDLHDPGLTERRLGIGVAVISGVCPVRLDIEEESDTFAEIEHEETGFLKSGGSGSATILWKEPGTGADKWAVVRLGDAQPIIRKAEMIDTLKQGDTEPATAWLLKYENDAWERTDQQIDLYGDQGFRGVAFGKTSTVDAGDKIDVYFSHEAKHWYGVVGGCYFHGDVVDDIPHEASGPVRVNVGAGADFREVIVTAFSP